MYRLHAHGVEWVGRSFLLHLPRHHEEKMESSTVSVQTSRAVQNRDDQKDTVTSHSESTTMKLMHVYYL